MTIDASMGVSLHSARVPGTGSRDSVLRSLWLAQPRYIGQIQEGYFRAPPTALYEKSQLFSETNRVTSSLQVNHDALDWLNHRLTVGLDFSDTRNSEFNPFLSQFASQFWTDVRSQGRREEYQESWFETSFDYGASASANLSGAVASTTSVGFQVNTKKRNQTTGIGERFPTIGVATVGAAAVTSGASNVIENNTVGVYVQQQFGWEDRRFITLALRADDNSAFGSDFSLVTYPKVSASWVVSEESFWNVGFVNALRLRGAFGVSGQQPDVFAAVRTFVPSSLPDGTPAVRPGSPGNADLGPERAQEIEAGFDASLFNDRLALDFTYYSQVTKDAIVARNVPPSSGFSVDQFVNIGEMTNKGFEVGMQAGLVDTDGFDWDLNFTVGTNENEITDLGLEGGSGIQLGLVTQHKEGFPAASIFSTHIVETTLDAAGDVTSVLCQDAEGPARGDRGSTGTINCSDAPQIYRGHPDPNAQGSLGTTFTFGDVRLDVLSDFALGQQNYSVWGWWHYGNLGAAEQCWNKPDGQPVEWRPERVRGIHEHPWCVRVRRVPGAQRVGGARLGLLEASGDHALLADSKPVVGGDWLEPRNRKPRGPEHHDALDELQALSIPGSRGAVGQCGSPRRGSGGHGQTATPATVDLEHQADVLTRIHDFEIWSIESCSGQN